MGNSWTGDVDDAEEESDEEPEVEVEGLDDMDESDQPEEPEDNEPSNGPPTPDSAVAIGDSANPNRRWKVMVWGPPKTFKTYLSLTMPEPIAFINLEGKVDDKADKFADKNIQMWRPEDIVADPNTKFRRAKKALDEALEWLEWYHENEGRRGTIVVDSISQLWEWAKVHHKKENYNKDPEKVELSLINKGGESDWAIIKEYHNGEFRDRISESPFHFCWTAMEREDFEESLGDEDNRRFMEPKGEADNDYKADTIIRARTDKDRGKVGDLVGSNFTKNVFVGLKEPTFPKVKDAITQIEEAEASESDVTRGKLAKEIGAEAIIDFNPQVYLQK